MEWTAAVTLWLDNSTNSYNPCWALPWQISTFLASNPLSNWLKHNTHNLLKHRQNNLLRVHRNERGLVNLLKYICVLLFCIWSSKNPKKSGKSAGSDFSNTRGDKLNTKSDYSEDKLFFRWKLLDLLAFRMQNQYSIWGESPASTWRISKSIIISPSSSLKPLRLALSFHSTGFFAAGGLLLNCVWKLARN